MEPDEKACPFCAEAIKAAAIKCKHCGEMLIVAAPAAVTFACPSCDAVHDTERSLYLHRVNEHHYVSYRGGPGDAGPSQRPKGKQLSAVARRQPDGALACPKCGGTQFKVQRKTSTKLMFGVASMLGNAKWVRCVSCGERYRRG